MESGLIQPSSECSDQALDPPCEGGEKQWLSVFPLWCTVRGEQERLHNVDPRWKLGMWNCKPLHFLNKSKVKDFG